MTGKRKLVMALTAVLALTGGISGQAALGNTLDEVIVTAEKDQVEAKVLPGGFEREETSFGLTGEQDIMTVPYTAPEHFSEIHRNDGCSYRTNRTGAHQCTLHSHRDFAD